MLKKDGIYFAYLRKSREDRDAEIHGEGETLARHERILDELAEKMGVIITRKYKEVVSGETIAARPQMMQMLEDIEDVSPDGVFVVELERLARGDTRDQGLIMETFKYSDSKIITPMKTYNPNDEFDEEYAEFGLFMSRREYKTIKRRLYNGRIAAVKEGKFPAGKVPYGYKRYKLPDQKGYSLQIIPEEAAVVRLVFDLYTTGTEKTGYMNLGAKKITNILNDMHIPPSYSDTWSPGVIRDMLSNCVYVGRVRFGRRKTVKKMKDGVMQSRSTIQKDCTTYAGLQEPIISQETWNLAQEIFERKSRRPPFLDVPLQNPLASLLKCRECGRTLVRKKATAKCPALYVCPTTGCPTVGSYQQILEERVIEAMNIWLDDYRLTYQEHQNDEPQEKIMLVSALSRAMSDNESLTAQLDNVYDMFETKVYSLDVFTERSSILKKKIANCQIAIDDINQNLNSISDATHMANVIIPRMRHVLDVYWTLDSAEEKNTLLKEVLVKIVYEKATHGNKRGQGVDDFKLQLFPRL